MFKLVIVHAVIVLKITANYTRCITNCYQAKVASKRNPVKLRCRESVGVYNENKPDNLYVGGHHILFAARPS